MGKAGIAVLQSWQASNAAAKAYALFEHYCKRRWRGANLRRSLFRIFGVYYVLHVACAVCIAGRNCAREDLIARIQATRQNQIGILNDQLSSLGGGSGVAMQLRLSSIQYLSTCVRCASCQGSRNNDRRVSTYAWPSQSPIWV